MTVLRLEPLGGSHVDRALAAVGSATLTRREDGAFVEVAVADVARLVRALAFAGVAASACDADLAAPRGLVPAVGRDLAPLARPLAGTDIVRVRRLTLGEATREVLRRRLGGLLPAPAPARDRARALLRGEDVLLAWTRRAWLTRGVLRAGPVRRSLRPIVFDREALERPDPGGRTFASSGALQRWLFA